MFLKLSVDVAAPVLSDLLMILVGNISFVPFPSWQILILLPTCREQPVQFSSVQDGIYALGKTHTRSTPSLRSFPNVAFKTVPLFVWSTVALSRPFKEDSLALPLSTPLYVHSLRQLVSVAC